MYFFLVWHSCGLEANGGGCHLDLLGFLSLETSPTCPRTTSGGTGRSIKTSTVRFSPLSSHTHGCGAAQASYNVIIIRSSELRVRLGSTNHHSQFAESVRGPTRKTLCDLFWSSRSPVCWRDVSYAYLACAWGWSSSDMLFFFM